MLNYTKSGQLINCPDGFDTFKTYKKFWKVSHRNMVVAYLKWLLKYTLTFHLKCQIVRLPCLYFCQNRKNINIFCLNPHIGTLLNIFFGRGNFGGNKWVEAGVQKNQLGYSNRPQSRGQNGGHRAKLWGWSMLSITG